MTDKINSTERDKLN